MYLIFDCYPRIYLDAKSWGFRDEIQRFRTSAIKNEEDVFWDHVPLKGGANLKAIRILVCGNAGVGKSTLLNKVFGLPMVRAHRILFEKQS